MNRAVDIVAGNWQMNGILSLRTGQPFTINGTQCLGNWGKCMPDLVPGNSGTRRPPAAVHPGATATGSTRAPIK